ncbi:MAG: ferrous iron transporter B, partial [Myxococcales bacterium]|nr:ferrous iron transporter B [Myxococcales bacterium]
TPAPAGAAAATAHDGGGGAGEGAHDDPSATAQSDAAHAALVDRFAAADAIVDAAVVEPDSRETASDRADRVLLHPVWGLIVFAAAMFLFFQAIFVVAAPLQDLCEGAVLALGEVARQVLPEGLLQSLIVDGIIAGVGGVVVFVPQIAILLLLLRLMEGSGYMARAAFLVDRVMGSVGLEGRSFVALLSSYACAVPGIMATRTIPDPRSRLATILVAPLMTCSARLPVYALLIGAFVPARSILGVFSLQGIVLLALYALGSGAAFGVAAILHRIGRRRAFFPFYMELPPYRLPSAKALLTQTWQGVRAFLRKAGTVILAASVVLWALLSFPKVVVPDDVVATASSPEEADALASAYALEHSAAASIGHAMEPIVAPLGYDWRIGVGILGSFAAREVIVATLAQLFAFSAGEDDIGGLGERIAAECQPAPDTGECVPKYTLATALSLLVFFVFSLQCVSTLAVIRRETGTWRWPAFAFAYMLGLAYVGAWLTYVAARALGA